MAVIVNPGMMISSNYDIVSEITPSYIHLTRFVIFHMKYFLIFIFLAMSQLNGCGYGLRYVVSNTFYVGGEEFNVTPEKAGLEYVAVEFDNGDGDTLHGWYVKGKENYPVVIYFHGNVSNVTHGLDKIKLLNKLGYSILSFEYRGYGKSEGWALYEDDFYRDARSALRYLQSKGWENDETIYFGHSLGASVALDLAAEEPPLGLIMESAFTSYAGMIKHQTPYAYVFGGWKVKEFDNVAKISKIKIPIVIFHGVLDEIVPLHMSKSLYDAAKGPKRLHQIKDANHVNAIEMSTELLIKDLEWFHLIKKHSPLQ